MGLLSYQDDLSKQTATLMESLREYATNFTHKEELLERVAPDRMKQLRAFQQLFTDEIELVRQQLQQEQRQEELVETLRDEELNNEEVKELRSVQDHIDALKHALEQQQRVLHDAADDVAEYQELSRDSVVQGTDEAMRILDRLRRHIVKLQEAVGKERHILDEEEAIVEQLHEQIAEATDFPPIGAVDFPAVDAAKRVATYCDAFGKARIVNLSYIANVPRQAAKQTGLVLYPGCGADMSVLFCFPNCSTYVLQDPEDEWVTEIEERLEFLQRTNVIEGLQKYNHRYRFYWNKQRKTLVCYDGKQGRSDTFTPSEIGTNSIDAIMTRKFRSVPDSIREEVMKRYIPALKHGAYVHKDFLVQSEAFTPVTKHWLQYL